jgi:hypothetical protein
MGRMRWGRVVSVRVEVGVRVRGRHDDRRLDLLSSTSEMTRGDKERKERKKLDYCSTVV